MDLMNAPTTGGVLVAGHVCVDLVPGFAGPARIEPGALFDVGALGVRVGGSIANTGRVLAGLGVPVRAHGVVGADDLGRIIARQLDGIEGVTADLAVTEAHATSYSIVVQPPGEDRSFWHHTGANDAFDGSTIDPCGARLVHLGYPPLLPGIADHDGRPLASTLARVKAAGATTSLDLAVVDPDSRVGQYDWERVLAGAMPHTDILTPSLDDLTSALRMDARPGLDEELADRLVAQGAGVVAISSGADGLIVRAGSRDRLARGGPVLRELAAGWADARVRVDPVPVESVETTNGAGDAASGGLLVALLHGMPPERAARYAAATAADWIASALPI